MFTVASPGALGLSQECENPGLPHITETDIVVVDGGNAAINNPKPLLVKTVSGAWYCLCYFIPILYNPATD